MHPHAPANRRSPPHYAPTEPVPLPPQPPPPPPHTSVCVVVAAAAASSSRREPNTLFWRMHSQPNSHRAKHDDETGSSLGHTAPVWPAPTRERLLSRVGGHKGECPVGDLLNSPNRGRKDTVQNGSGLPFWAYFFFSGRTRPIIYTSGWSGQFRCQKSAPADLRSCRDFSGHHHGPDKKKQRWWWWRVCASSSHNQREQRAIWQALTSTSLWCIRPGGLDPPPRPMHECVGVCMPYVIAHRPYF